MQHWYVYYKLDPATVRDLEPRLRRMQQDVAAASGVRTRLMRRAGDDGGLATVLEAYEGIEQPEAFVGALGAALARADLPASLIAQRRTEKFQGI